ncbi:hypothetical protein PO909_029384 [Leuciscus waleckii]
MFEQSDSDEESEEDEEVTFTDVAQTLSTDSDGQFSLPPHLRITDIPVAELNTVCAQFGIKCFNDREYLFLKEYCIVLKPLTVALDILQGEDNCYFGTLLPTLEILMSRTLALRDELRMTASLPDVIVLAIKISFSSMMDNKKTLLAAVTLPKFKLRWIREEEKKDTVRAMLTTECRGLPLEDQQHNDQHHKHADSTDDFFSFEEEDCTYSAETEVMEYLKSAGSGQSCAHPQEKPTVKQTF